MFSILAVDSGGSKAEALLVGEDGGVIGWGRCDVDDPGAGRAVGGSGRSRETVARAVRQAIGSRRFEELHIKGIYDRFGTEALAGVADLIVTEVVSEHTGALALAGVDVGVVALAGTGAFVRGETRDGRNCHRDGLGPNVGDYGSAYQIGMMAIRAAARSGWHPRHRTSIADPVFQACVNQPADPKGSGLVPYMLAPRDRAEIASLARIVDREANAGDQIACEILLEAATGLAETLYDVVDTLGIARDEYMLVGTGSVATRSTLYWQHFCKLAAEFAPGLTPFISQLPPVVGEALTILHHILGGVSAEIRQRLMKSAESAVAAWQDNGQIPASPEQRT